MKKQIIKRKIDYEKEFNSNYDADPYPINEVVEFLKEAILKGATHVEFSGYSFDGLVEDITIVPIFLEEESDESFNKPVLQSYENERFLKEQTEYNERKMLEKLKAKYE